MLLLLSKLVAAADLGSTLCAAALASPQLLLPDAPLESCMTGGVPGSNPGLNPGSRSRSSSRSSEDSNALVISLGEDSALSEEESERLSRSVSTVRKTEFHEPSESVRKTESAKSSESVLKTESAKSTKSIAVEAAPPGCPSQYVRRRPMVFIPILIWEGHTTDEQRENCLLAMAAYEKFLSKAKYKFVRLPGCYRPVVKRGAFPYKRRLVFDVLRKRIDALIDWVKKAEEQRNTHPGELDCPYPPIYIGLAKRTACGMMLAIGQMFDLEWPLVVEPPSEGCNFVYNDVGQLLELFENSRGQALGHAQDNFTRYKKPEGAEPLPGGLDPLSKLMASAPVQSPHWAVSQWTKDYIRFAKSSHDTQREWDALRLFRNNFKQLRGWHSRTGVELRTVPMPGRGKLHKSLLRVRVKLLLRQLAWAVGAVESQKNALMRSLMTGGKALTEIKHQLFLKSIYGGQRVACDLAKSLITLVTEEQNVPDTVYYRYIPLLLEALARPCYIWPKIEEALSPGNWTPADDSFKAQPLATRIPSLPKVRTQRTYFPVQELGPMQCLTQLVNQPGPQPAPTQNESQNRAVIQNRPLVQNRTVVQNTVPLQDEPLDLSKNKSCPQNPVTESTPLNRTPPPPYEGRHTVQSNVHQQFSYGNTYQHPHPCTGQCVLLDVPSLQQLYTNDQQQYPSQYSSQYAYPAQPNPPAYPAQQYLPHMVQSLLREPKRAFNREAVRGGPYDRPDQNVRNEV